MPNPTGLSLLGSTGSIGTQTLDIVRMFPDRLRVVSLTAHANVPLVIEQAREFRPELVVVSDGDAYAQVRQALHGEPVRVASGPSGLSEAVELDSVDTVVAAIVGFAGLMPVLAALRKGLRVALANKETLVAAGRIVRSYVDEYGGSVIPVDSEHSAIFQCLQGEPTESVESLILTASGGAFRDRPLSSFDDINVDEALMHPNWSMGAKITVDSATMMNKGLEVIEAHWLFHMPASRISVVVHPQSIVHSIVNFVDGSSKAQLGAPDMSVPIQYAITYPNRWTARHPRVNWDELRQLDFIDPDPVRYPCLQLAYEALARGGSHPAALNAANEAAVSRFLDGSLGFTDISRTIESVLDRIDWLPQPTIEELHDLDEQARKLVLEQKTHRVH